MPCSPRSTCLRRVGLVALAVGLAGASLPAATTATFGGPDATCPDTMKVAGKTLTFDLSAVGGAEVHRAVFRPKRGVFNGQDAQALEKVTVTSAGRPVELMPPRYVSFDATEAVRAALKAGRALTLQAESLPGWDGRTARLEVTFAGKAGAKLPAVSHLAARHRGGQTILTFREAEPPITDEGVTIEQFRAVRKKLPDAGRKLTYRIYRATAPITAETIGAAELVDEIGPLTCWNDEYYGVYPKKDSPALRYAVQDGEGPVPPGTGIYAHNPAKAGKAWYAVAVAVHGAEDLDALGEGNVLGPIDEAVGPGEPVLQRVERPKSFMYRQAPTLRYYVRWEAPPRCNLPSRPFDYLVGVPEKPQWPAPVYMAFHCWGASLNGGFGWWYHGPEPSLIVSTNQIPYDWWTGYHEAMGTHRPWSAGVVRSYTQKRYDAFFDWVCGKWQVDRTRTIAGGNSMGGAGAPVYGTHRPNRVAWVSSWVGVHVPAETPHFLGSYELCYGRAAWKLPHEDGRTAFEHFDDAAWVRARPEVDMPLICFGNGKDDGGIGWPQALAYFRALQEARQPHVFHWALGGHGVRATLPGPGASGSTLPLDVRTDQSLPAFTRCSLDEDPGTGKRLATPKEHKSPDGHVRKDPCDGDPEGHANRWLTWDTKTVIDEPSRWEMTVALLAGAPKDECTVNVTPRRLQQLKPRPGQAFAWTAAGAAGGGEAAQRGTVTADKWGLLTLENVRVTKGGSRLRIGRQE
ncbi:MAG TPA: hypothetical protein VM695_00905 [Phycisphaerae bacterium]|nr:hypothetical protein [Phycisphaerae bacterium]